jgi:hypothetical protein
MKQVIVLQQSSETTLIGLHLTKNEFLNIVIKKEIEDLFSLLDILGAVDLIVCDKAFSNEIQSKYTDLMIFTVNGLSEIEANLKEITQLLGQPVEKDQTNGSELEQFKAISIDYFSSIKSLSVNSDLYIKIKKGNSEQFIKRLNANELFTSQEIEKYTQLGLSEFYVAREKYDMVVNSIINLLTAELSNESNSFDSQKNIEHNTFHISIERMRTIGLDEFTVQLVDETVHSMSKSLNEKAALGKFLKFLLENKSSYTYASSYLTCLTMTSLLKLLKRESEASEEQITMSSFFHNISLEDETSLKVFNNVQLEALQVSKDKRDSIKIHALTASGMVSEYAKISPLVLTIIKEHHGSPTGVDFPEPPSHKIHPMSKCFMVCEYFADQVIKKGPNIKKSDVDFIVTHLKKKFGQEGFLEFSHGIEKMTAS